MSIAGLGMVTAGPISIGGSMTAEVPTHNASIEIELGFGLTNSGHDTLDLNDANARWLAGKTGSGTKISLSDFYGKRNVYIITANYQNLNLRDWLLTQGWPGVIKPLVELAAGYYLWSDDNTLAGLYITGSFPNGVQFTNYGYIMGKGGRGYPVYLTDSLDRLLGFDDATWYAQRDGGPAISLGTNGVVIVNNSYIAGGGGGGGVNKTVTYDFGGSGGGAGGGRGGGYLTQTGVRGLTSNYYNGPDPAYVTPGKGGGGFDPTNPANTWGTWLGGASGGTDRDFLGNEPGFAPYNNFGEAGHAGGRYFPGGIQDPQVVNRYLVSFTRSARLGYTAAGGINNSPAPTPVNTPVLGAGGGGWAAAGYQTSTTTANRAGVGGRSVVLNGYTFTYINGGSGWIWGLYA